MENEEMKKKIISLLDKIFIEQDEDKIYALLFEFRNLKNLDVGLFKSIFIKFNNYDEKIKKVGEYLLTDKWTNIKNGKQTIYTDRR